MTTAAQTTLNASPLWCLIAPAAILTLYALLYTWERFIAWRREHWYHYQDSVINTITKERKVKP